MAGRQIINCNYFGNFYKFTFKVYPRCKIKQNKQTNNKQKQVTEGLLLAGGENNLADGIIFLVLVIFFTRFFEITNCRLKRGK